VIEGFATFIEERAAGLLNYPSTFTRVMSVERVKHSNLPQAVRLSMNRRNEMYISGAKFFHSIYKRGGIEAVWQEVKSPVRDSEYISRIIQADGKAIDAGRGTANISESLDTLAHIFETRGYRVAKQDLSGPQFNAFLGDDSLERALALNPELRVNSLLMQFSSTSGAISGLVLIIHCSNPNFSEDLRKVLLKKSGQKAIQNGDGTSQESGRTLSIMGTRNDDCDRRFYNE
jgi:hypothetical protein